MSQDQVKTNAFVKKFDSIMTSITNLKSLSHLAHLFNDLPEVNQRVKEVFYHYLPHYDNLKIKKCLDILEFLTFHSNSQLISIVTDEKVIELLPYALSDDDLQEPVLNLLKLWTDQYRDEKHNMTPIFDCIDGLSAFGIFLPSSYTSKYEGSVLEPPEPATSEEKPQPSGENTLAQHVKSKTISILERAQVLRDESRSLLDDNTFQYLSNDFKKDTLEGLLGSHRQLALEKAGMKLDNAVDEIKGSIEALFIVLKAQERKLSHMYEKLDKKEDIEVESVTSVETNGDHYKIVISGAEDKQQEGGFSTAMNREEFQDYKVYPCKKGIDCPYHGDPEVFSEEERNYHEMQCPYWHSSHDKRRSVEAIDGDRKYFGSLCVDLPACRDEDACEFSHNFFEKVFHPTNYKKKRCPMNSNECINGKYCPHYHSKKEEQNWKFAKNTSFASNSNNDSDVSFGDYDAKALEQFWEREAQRAVDDMDGLSKGFELPREVIIPYQMGVRNRENIDAAVGRKADEVNKQKELEEMPPSQVEMKGNLNGKLVVRRSYNDPSVLTNLFTNNACFNLMPFICKQAQSAQESPQEGEQIVGKVKQGVISDEARESAAAVTILI